MEPGADITILVSTWDGYECVWPPLCHGFQKYWPDCPWPIVFTTNFLDPPCGAGLKLGRDECDWTGNMRKALEVIRSPVLLYMSEDNWLSGKVDTPALQEFADLILSGKVNYLRLSWKSQTRASGVYEYDRRLVVLKRETSGRTSLHPAFWRISVLKSLLRGRETPWHFEGMAPPRSVKFPAFLALARKCHAFPIVSHVDPDWSIDPVRGGRWTEAAKTYAKREGLEIDFTVEPETHMERG